VPGRSRRPVVKLKVLSARRTGGGRPQPAFPPSQPGPCGAEKRGNQVFGGTPNTIRRRRVLPVLNGIVPAQIIVASRPSVTPGRVMSKPFIASSKMSSSIARPSPARPTSGARPPPVGITPNSEVELCVTAGARPSGRFSTLIPTVNWTHKIIRPVQRRERRAPARDCAPLVIRASEFEITSTSSDPIAARKGQARSQSKMPQPRCSPELCQLATSQPRETPSSLLACTQPPGPRPARLSLTARNTKPRMGTPVKNRMVRAGAETGVSCRGRARRRGRGCPRCKWDG